MSEYPSISIVIPTLNSEKTLSECLASIREQDYPREKLEIIIADAGSKDNTLEIARGFPVDRILKNPLKTGEAGKMVGIKEAGKEIIALIDSDNILEGEDWLKRMTEPFKDSDIVASEPLNYTYRREDGFITRYCALLGMNDPLCHFLGNYDRYDTLSGRWTQMPVSEEEKGGYLKIVLLDERRLPTIGANGFLVRKKELLNCQMGDYLFDIDIIHELFRRGENKMAKVKVGIVHLFSGNIKTFARKQRRRIKDYFYFSRERRYPWKSMSRLRLLKFIIYSLLLFPLILQAFSGYVKRRDRAWFFHPLACLITLGVYGLESIKSLFFKSMETRKRWG